MAVQSGLERRDGEPGRRVAIRPPVRDNSFTRNRQVARDIVTYDTAVNTPLSPKVLRAYLLLSNIVSPEGNNLSVQQILPDVFRALLSFDLETISRLMSLVFQTESSMKIDLRQPDEVTKLLMQMKNTFTALLEDKSADPKFRQFIHFFLFLLNENKIPSGVFHLDHRIGGNTDSIMYPGQRMRFGMRACSKAVYIPSMAVTAQALVMEDVQPLPHGGHRLPDDLLQVLFFIDSSQPGELIPVTTFRDPLVFIPEITRPSVFATAAREEMFKNELKKLWGLFAETLYDFMAPFNLTISDHPTVSFSITGVLNALLEMHPTTGFVPLRRQSRSRSSLQHIQEYFADSNMGATTSFQDKRMVFNGPQQQYNEHSRHFQAFNPEQLVSHLEQLLLTRFNNNVAQLRVQIARVVEIAHTEAIRTLKSKKRGKVSAEDELILKARIAAGYSTWLGMALSQYERIVQQPIQAYCEFKTESLDRSLQNMGVR